jgi:hypothetical protein
MKDWVSDDEYYLVQYHGYSMGMYPIYRFPSSTSWLEWNSAIDELDHECLVDHDGVFVSSVYMIYKHKQCGTMIVMH